MMAIDFTISVMIGRGTTSLLRVSAFAIRLLTLMQQYILLTTSTSSTMFWIDVKSAARLRAGPPSWILSLSLLAAGQQ